MRGYENGGLSVVSVAAFAADHTMGGGVNVAHAGVLAVMATAVVLWPRFLWPALIVHALYDACVFAWG
ncbi:CPBP family glutamic-type intramembrane protease [Streptomyces sp. NPDC001251]|uniref:CPBP family glutamic-type intramembrane protease n=1 Tax=unclassified Streptomyces TaxID=2593676 RepID=UPI0035D6E5D0